MKNSAKILSLLVFYTLVSCNPDGPKTEVVAAPIPYCFVYCDFTNSMDTIAHDKVVRDALTIYDSLSRTHRLSFFTIGNNPFRELIATSSFVTEGLMSETERNFKLLAVTRYRDTLKKNLVKAQREETSGKTCIIKNIKQALQHCLNISESGDGNFKLIFLSDMLENCEGINIQSDRYRAADSLVSKMQPADSFSKFKNLTIAVVISYSKDNVDDRLTEFWEKVFAKFKYTGARIRPSPSIPWEKLR